MKGKPEGKPSGNHPFDMVCAKTKIDHRLTKPFKPQTNGMVERFNRRIAEAIGRENKRAPDTGCSPATTIVTPSSTSWSMTIIIRD